MCFLNQVIKVLVASARAFSRVRFNTVVDIAKSPDHYVGLRQRDLDKIETKHSQGSDKTETT